MVVFRCLDVKPTESIAVSHRFVSCSLKVLQGKNCIIARILFLGAHETSRVTHAQEVGKRCTEHV